MHEMGMANNIRYIVIMMTNVPNDALVNNVSYPYIPVDNMKKPLANILKTYEQLKEVTVGGIISGDIPQQVQKDLENKWFNVLKTADCM